jgi:hypothetical protein
MCLKIAFLRNDYFKTHRSNLILFCILMIEKNNLINLPYMYIVTWLIIGGLCKIIFNFVVKMKSFCYFFHAIKQDLPIWNHIIFYTHVTVILFVFLCKFTVVYYDGFRMGVFTSTLSCIILSDALDCILSYPILFFLEFTIFGSTVAL